jgi:hypothetical protein
MPAAPQGQETGHLPCELDLVPGRTKAIPRQRIGEWPSEGAHAFYVSIFGGVEHLRVRECHGGMSCSRLSAGSKTMPFSHVATAFQPEQLAKLTVRALIKRDRTAA